MSALHWGESETRRGAVRREFVCREESARMVPGVLWEPEQPKPGAPLIAFGHGASGDRHQAPIPYLAKRLVREHGGRALAIDGPVHGERRIGDGGRDAFWQEWKRATTVDDMIDDWRRVLDAVLALPDGPRGPVGYWGLSMGTIYGAPLVAADTRIEAAVLGLMGLTGPSSGYRERIAADAARIRVPVLFLLQLEDELFEREACLALFDALATDDKRIHAHPGAHAAVPAEDIDGSLDFLVARLQPAASGGR
jgi:dienelactone hydrolase